MLLKNSTENVSNVGNTEFSNSCLIFLEQKQVLFYFALFTI